MSNFIAPRQQQEMIMSVSAATIVSELPHAVWRADQMGSCRNPVISTSHPELDRELPNGGWPASSLIELLLQQPGIGEMRLLRPTLAAIARQRRIALVQPPHLPQIAAWSGWGLAPERLLWIKTARSADALWSAEQILRSGSCGALLFWQTHVRSEALRRLHLAAQESDIVFWMIRPLSTAQDSSPAPLRLALRPASAGVAINIVKRRGPWRDDALYLRLDDKAAASFNTTSLNHLNHAPVDRRVSPIVVPRNVPAALV
jgi:protein ImuA